MWQVGSYIITIASFESLLFVADSNFETSTGHVCTLGMWVLMDGPDEPIGIPSDRPARWISVARAMAIQENGTAQIDDFAMLKGFDLARQEAK